MTPEFCAKRPIATWLAPSRLPTSDLAGRSRVCAAGVAIHAWTCNRTLSSGAKSVHAPNRRDEETSCFAQRSENAKDEAVKFCSIASDAMSGE